MILLFLLAAVSAATPRPSDLKLFGDWTVGCDNMRACHAVALVPEDWPEGAGTMSVSRGPEAGAAVVIDILPDEGVANFLEADGRRLAVRLVQGENGARAVAADVPALLAALRSATQLKLFGRDGASLGTVSLAGASAALLYMDETQRRIGTVTALVRPGARPASAVPPPPPLPIVRAVRPSGAPIALGAARIKALRTTHGCTIGEVGGPDEAEASAIGPGQTLLLLACGSGAYNVSYVPFVVQRRGGQVQVALAPFDVHPGWWEEGRPTLINAGWDGAGGLLTSFSKSRGLGDCGVGNQFAWDGARFRLVHQQEMGECRGSRDYVTTWRARVVRR